AFRQIDAKHVSFDQLRIREIATDQLGAGQFCAAELSVFEIEAAEDLQGEIGALPAALVAQPAFMHRQDSSEINQFHARAPMRIPAQSISGSQNHCERNLL